MQTNVDRKVTNTKWTDNLKENDAVQSSLSFRAEFANMRLHMIAFLQETLLYDNQQKQQLRLTSRAAKGRA